MPARSTCKGPAAISPQQVQQVTAVAHQKHVHACQLSAAAVQVTMSQQGAVSVHRMSCPPVGESNQQSVRCTAGHRLDAGSVHPQGASSSLCSAQQGTTNMSPASSQQSLMCTPGNCTAAGGSTSMQDMASFTAGELVLCISPYSSHSQLQWSSGYVPLHIASQPALHPEWYLGQSLPGHCIHCAYAQTDSQLKSNCRSHLQAMSRRPLIAWLAAGCRQQVRTGGTQFLQSRQEAMHCEKHRLLQNKSCACHDCHFSCAGSRALLRGSHRR